MSNDSNSCKRCGACCIIVPCDYAQSIFGEVGFCPELSFDGQIAVCGLVEKLGEGAIGVGEGCVLSEELMSGYGGLISEIRNEIKMKTTKIDAYVSEIGSYRGGGNSEKVTVTASYECARIASSITFDISIDQSKQFFVGQKISITVDWEER